LGDEKDVPASPRRHESNQEQVPLIKQMFVQIIERNRKMKVSMEAQAGHHIAPDQTRLLTSMDLEKDKFKISLSHHSDMSIGSSNNVNIVNFIVYVKKRPLLDKVNLHIQTIQRIVNDLTKTNAMALKADNMLEKVIKSLKLEKANSRALKI